jgi:putative transcriptional regulator
MRTTVFVRRLASPCSCTCRWLLSKIWSDRPEYRGRDGQSRILRAVHETATGLAQSGLITKRRLAELEALCQIDVGEMSAQQIKSLRESVQVSQAVLTAILNTSVSTVQKWEIGDKRPSGPSLKLLHLIERKGIEAVL